MEAAGWSRHRLERLLLLPGALTEKETLSDGTSYDYGPAFEGAERAVAAFLAVGREGKYSPTVLFDELKSFPEDVQISLVGSEARYAEPELARYLIDLSHELRYQDHNQMLHCTHLARIVADRVTAEAVGSEAKHFDLRARAWGHFGNSLRVCGRLREAEESFGIAQRFARQGTGDPLLKARLSELQSSLHISQRRFVQAIQLAEEAGRIYKELGEIQPLAVTMVGKAVAYLYDGDPEMAVFILNHAIPLIDGTKDPRLLLAACHNLSRCYIDLEMPEHALALYNDTREFYKEFEDTLILLRVNWQEGQLLRDLGRLGTAEEALVQARDGFRDRGLVYEVALVSLDLAMVYVKLGFTEEARKTITEALPTFRTLQVDRETIASLLQLQQVAGQEAQALRLIRMITVQLEQFSGRRTSF